MGINKKILDTRCWIETNDFFDGDNRVSWEGILLVIGGYLVGSIPTGVVLSKLFGAKDVRQEGSGNIGATNVYRVSGAKLGILTLLGDVAKGTIPVALICSLMDSEMWIAAVALSTFLGHLFPLFLKFRGGKGVATALGIFLVITPLVLPCVIVDLGLVIGCLTFYLHWENIKRLREGVEKKISKAKEF
ncbi:MAG: glycerol-3-phosphate acyltransferase [Deltaproteobacteria bacterium]|nr:glycerol-3-phosphate acyltransferase [Deltaproteobacteria bacterium]